MGSALTAQLSGNTEDTSGEAAGVDTLIIELGSSDRTTRSSAHLALVHTGAAAVEALCAALASGDTLVRWEAAKCLRRINDPAAAPALVAALEDDDAGVRWIAADALTCLGKGALVPLLTALMHRSDSLWLRNGAHHVLNALPGEALQATIGPVLAALEDIEPDLGVPVAAHEALFALRGKS